MNFLLFYNIGQTPHVNQEKDFPQKNNFSESYTSGMLKYLLCTTNQIEYDKAIKIKYSTKKLS